LERIGETYQNPLFYSRSFPEVQPEVPAQDSLGQSKSRTVIPVNEPERLMAKLKLDLHEIYNRNEIIEEQLNRVIEEAIEKRIKIVEIIPGKGSGQLKKRVLRFLNQKHIRDLYHRVEKDDKNFGRIFVHFRHK